MKKTLTFLTTCVVGALCAFTIATPYFKSPTTASAAEFFQSPTGEFAPEIKDFKNDDKDCTAILKLTPFEKRDRLEDYELAAFEDAYDSIVDTADITTLNEDFAALVKELGLDPTQVAVSELFNLSVSNCDEHDDHNESTVKLEINSVDTFVALLQYVDDEWVLVKNVKVNNTKSLLTFNTVEFTPYAIVLDTSSFIQAPAPEVDEIDKETVKQEILKETGVTAGISALVLLVLVKMLGNN